MRAIEKERESVCVRDGASCGVCRGGGLLDAEPGMRRERLGDALMADTEGRASEDGVEFPLDNATAAVDDARAATAEPMMPGVGT